MSARGSWQTRPRTKRTLLLVGRYARRRRSDPPSPPRWGEAEEARGWIQEPKATSCGKLELGGEIGGSGSEHGFRLKAAFRP